MCNGDYGKMTFIGQSDVAVYFAHTGDNSGPQSAEAIQEIYQELHKQYPKAELSAATLEDVAKVALLEENLPVITDEIGDTWIHGIGSDPGKVSSYRALLRLKDRLPKAEMDKLYKHLIMVPEHTWGKDEKTTLSVITGDICGEHRYFVRNEFEEIRPTEKFQQMEQSWQEQRDYVNAAVESLYGKSRELAKEAVSGCLRSVTSVDGWREVQIMEKIVSNGYKLQVNETGAICALEHGDCMIADEAHPMGQFVYQVLSQHEYDRWREQYVIIDERWAIEDFGKIGVDKAIDFQKDYVPQVEKIYQKDNQIVIIMTLPEEATALYGGMDCLEMRVELGVGEINFDFAWFGKHASRVPEASWLQFAPVDEIVNMKKMGQWIDPSEVLENGNCHMHAVEAVQMKHFTIIPMDAPLVTWGQPWIMNFTNDTPDLAHGIWSNLHNNTWGTNFMMWYDEDARFRYKMQL